MQASDCLEVNGVCSATQICRPGGLMSAPCASDTDCVAFHTCTPQGKCVLYPQTGQACTAGCLDSNCDPNSQLCTPPKANGAACAPNSGYLCASNYCDAPSLTCMTPATCI